MKFNPSARHTLGVEWELQLLDANSLDLVDGIIPLMEFFPDATYVKPELIQSCVELNSCIADNSTEAVEHLRQTLFKLSRRCAELNMSICAAGTHPFCHRLALITPLPRYRRAEEYGSYLAPSQITFSTHIHIGMNSGDQAMYVMSCLTPAMPPLIALSANSPFWRGHETGHAAYRHRILAAAPNYGVPTRFNDWLEFDEFLAAARRARMIETFKDIHWDMRPHPDIGTLEIRAMDAASNLRAVHGLVAFARCLALRVAEASAQEVSEVLPVDLPFWIERQNRFRASLRGLDAEYIVDTKGVARPLRDIIVDLFDFCEPVVAELEEERGMRIAHELLNDRPGYEQQLGVYKRHDSVRRVVEMLQQSLLDEINSANRMVSPATA